MIKKSSISSRVARPQPARRRREIYLPPSPARVLVIFTCIRRIAATVRTSRSHLLGSSGYETPLPHNRNYARREGCSCTVEPIDQPGRASLVHSSGERRSAERR